MKDISKNYIQIQGWMITELKLSGNELLTYALIFGFSQDGQTEFTGSLNYVCKWLSISRPTAIKTLKSLVEKNLITKTQTEVNNVTFNKYKTSLRVVKKLNGGSKETLQGGSKETLPNNTNIDNTIYNKAEKSDFEGLENKTNQYLSNELNISKKQFLYLWNLARIKILGAKHSNYNTIPAYNISALETIAKNYCIGDIKKAIQGLFKQDCIPKMKSSPKHFLDVDNFETYLDAYNNKLSNLYDKPKNYKEQQL